MDLYDVAASGTCPLVWSYSTQGTNSAIIMDDAGLSFVVGQYHNPWNDIDGVWLFDTSGPPALWFHPTDEGMTSVDMTRDGGRMTCGGIEGEVDLMDSSPGDPLLTQYIGETVSEVAMSADGSYFAGVSRSGFLYLFESTQDGTSVDGIWKTPCETMLCHVPPGNPDNYHTIVVGGQAAAAHLMNHSGDFPGMCENQDDDRIFERQTETGPGGGVSELQPDLEGNHGTSPNPATSPGSERKTKTRPERPRR